MYRSKQTRQQRHRNLPRLARLPLTAAIYLAFGTAALAQEANPLQAAAQEPAPQTSQETTAQPTGRTATLEAVTVTAQKRVENLQKVPISIQVLGQEKLDELQVKDFNDYAQYLPSVSFDTGEGGTSVPYMRGIASGENSNHSGPQPSIGVYLDEQPVTTIGGVLDIHLYDINRVEALAGPQGTLYGASSQAGTLRIITNKPDPSAIAGGYALEANTTSNGDPGYVAEGFFNAPLGESAAVRIVAWDKKDGGYIDNKFGTRTFPSWDADSGGNGTINNAERAEENYNDVYTRGARAALKVNLGENWSITPGVMMQTQTSHGNFATDPSVGELAVHKFYPEKARDDWTQAALTVEGKIGNFDLTYAYAHLNRDIDSEFDYSDYSFWYDSLYGSGAYFYNDAGDLINPSQIIQGKDGYTKTSHELRIASPAENRLRFVAGLFWQQQTHDIFQRYRVVGDLTTFYEVPGWQDTIWLTNQVRKDHDEAIFGEVSYDFTDKLTGTVGARRYRYDNTLKGFFGFNANYSSNYGEALCFSAEQFRGSPCVNLDDEVEKSDTLGRANLTYHFSDSKMIYGTWSEGFRPGGLNRNGTVGPYEADKLTNWELGWKTAWADNRLTFNGAVFQEDWKDIQYSFLPPSGSGLTVIRNAGDARVRGLEADVSWAATYNFRVNGGLAYYDTELKQDYCGFNDINGVPVQDCPPGTVIPNDPADPTDDGVVLVTPAPKGSRLPVTPEFKGNLTGRYTFDIGTFEAYWQAAVVYVGERHSALLVTDRAAFGDLDAYTQVDLSAGIKRGNWGLDFYLKNATDERAELSKFSQCATEVCGFQPYTINSVPRMFGVRFSQEF
jgi:iron complex outermembrane recepter protein